MINFEEELKKFHPSLEIDETADAVSRRSFVDFTDFLFSMAENKTDDKKSEE